MLTITIRTDKPDAEIGLFDESKKIDYYTWQAHRQLAETIHAEINNLLQTNNKSLSDLQAIAVYKGPGSFTGLRIGISVANALAQSLEIPIVASNGEKWIDQALASLSQALSDGLALPEYGSPPHITLPKH